MAQPRRKRVNISILIPFLVLALIMGAMLYQRYRASREVPAVPPVQQGEAGRTAILFFVADGVRLEREARELEGCDTEADCIRGVVEELLNGPVGELESPLPEGTMLNDVVVDGDLVRVDFTAHLADELPSGSSAEMMAVYSIVDTITTNAPFIRRVKITIDGNPRSLLRHLDLSDPLTPDYTLEHGRSSGEERAGDQRKQHKEGAR